MRGNENQVALSGCVCNDPFQIPMRGNELLASVWPASDVRFQIPMRGNEVCFAFCYGCGSEFQIPMRGNEWIFAFVQERMRPNVSNPHEG